MQLCKPYNFCLSSLNDTKVQGAIKRCQENYTESTLTAYILLNDYCLHSFWIYLFDMNKITCLKSWLSHFCLRTLLVNSCNSLSLLKFSVLPSYRHKHILTHWVNTSDLFFLVKNIILISYEIYKPMCILIFSANLSETELNAGSLVPRQLNICYVQSTLWW